MKDFKLSMVQMTSVLGEVERNVDKMLYFIEKSEESDMICFPELCTTGYNSEESWKYQRDFTDTQIERICKASEEYGISVIFGLPEKSDSKPYISQAVVSPDGKFNVYRKTHLGRFEKEKFRQGDSFCCYDIENVKVGIELCWESHIPEISTCLRVKGAEVILMPHASFMDSEQRVQKWKKYLPARAYDNRVFVAACNTISSGRGGGTIVIDPRGDVIAEDTSCNDSVLHCILESKKLERESPSKKETMKGLDFFEARRPELYKDILEK